MQGFLNKFQFFLILVLVAGIFYFFDSNKSEELVVIANSANTIDVLEDLRQRGYIDNQVSFWTTFLLKAKEEIEPGVYLLKKNMGFASLNKALDNPEYKQVFIVEGMRKEEVAETLSNTLGWTDRQEFEFLNTLPICQFTGGEGYFTPGVYLIHKDETPEVIKEEMYQRLIGNFSEILQEPDENILNIPQVLTIASLIQREAAGKGDMRIISGVIWNRLFAEIPLQIDATLQYVKGDEELWWPSVHPDDKYLESPYNTYENQGLPPGPISNPGVAAIEAALDPTDTNCLFYLHDRSGNIHCSSTYDGHKRNISYYLP